jgi:riboflavin biosynthesis pyrimidine reductase
MDPPLQRLFPLPAESRPLRGLYLTHGLHLKPGPFVYTNFITSLDGRIAVGENAGYKIPKAITNDRDWRLYLELTAQADVVLTSRHYLNYLFQKYGAVYLLHGTLAEGLVGWRKEQGLSNQPAIALVTRTMDVSADLVRAVMPQPLYILTGREAPIARRQALEGAGARVLGVGPHEGAVGDELVSALTHLGFSRLYSATGPHVLHMLLARGRLDRLYLTLVPRLLGGTRYETFMEGGHLANTFNLVLSSMYLDPPNGEWPGQLLACFNAYDRAPYS